MKIAIVETFTKGQFCVVRVRTEDGLEGFGQVVPAQPMMPSEEVRDLRARLIMEEALELCEALGCMIEVQGKAVFIRTFPEVNMVGIADGCADLSVVTIGTMSACGIADVSLLKAVDENNLEKLGDDPNIIDGKLIKPKGHTPPDIMAVLEDQGYDPNPVVEEEEDDETDTEE